MCKTKKFFGLYFLYFLLSDLDCIIRNHHTIKNHLRITKCFKNTIKNFVNE